MSHKNKNNHSVVPFPEDALFAYALRRLEDPVLVRQIEDRAAGDLEFARWLLDRMQFADDRKHKDVLKATEAYLGRQASEEKELAKIEAREKDDPEQQLLREAYEYCPEEKIVSYILGTIEDESRQELIHKMQQNTYLSQRMLLLNQDIEQKNIQTLDEFRQEQEKMQAMQLRETFGEILVRRVFRGGRNAY